MLFMVMVYQKVRNCPTSAITKQYIVAFGDLAPGNLLTGFGFYNPFWLLDIANIAIVVHLVGAYQVYCQPLFAFVEKHAARVFPESDFINKDYNIPLPRGFRPYKLNLFCLIWRTIFVIITTIISMLMPFFNDVVGILGAFGFWPLTVYFPVEMYIVQKKIPKWSSRWISLQILSGACLIISIAAAAGSFAGVVTDLQTWRSGKDQTLCSEGEEEKYGWSDQWNKIGRNSSDLRYPIKTVEIDTPQSYSVPRSRLTKDQHYYHQHPSSESDCSPMYRTNRSMSNSFPITPSQYRTKQLQGHSASPRCFKYERNLMMAQTPTLGLSCQKMFGRESAVAGSVPNYMAATASARARSRSESAPMQRPLTPERGNLSSVKKRLSFAAPERDACAVMSDTELERNLSGPSSRYEMWERSNTLLPGQAI